MAKSLDAGDPAFWRAGAISTTIVMLIVLVFLTIDSLSAIRAGGSQVPHYSVIDREIGYAYSPDVGYDVPVIGVVTATDAVPSFVPLLEPLPHTPLGKLVATGELEPGTAAETTPMQALHHPRRPGHPT